MTENDQTCLEKLKTLRKQINWEIRQERVKFLDQFCSLIQDWQGQLPNLLDIFQPKEIDYLLKQLMHYIFPNYLNFLFSTGYKDKPSVDGDGKLVLRRSTALHYAARCKQYRLVGKLFEIYNKFDVNYIDEAGLTHFHVACMSGCDDVVQKFLELGQDPDCLAQKSVNPPLHLALKHNHIKVFKLLLRSGADPNLTDEYESTVLHSICLQEYNDNLAKIFFRISDEIHRSVNVDAQNKWGQTPLHHAVDFERKSIVELLLSRGANPNLTDRNGKTPLDIIIFQGKDDVNLVKMFFDLNDELYQSIKGNAQDQRGRTPLHYAVEKGLEKITELLLRIGANPNLADSMKYTPLHIICERNSNEDLAKIFFEVNHELHQTIEVETLDYYGRTPLQLTFCYNNRKATKSLLRNGANPNLANAKGLTPLHIICKRDKDDDLVDTFFNINKELNQLVQIDARDKMGQTPLSYAVTAVHKKHAESLLKMGADPNLANLEGLTPLHIICMRDTPNHHYLLNMLFELSNVDHQPLHVDAQDKLGQTPLHLALQEDNIQAAEMLLRQGANPNLEDAEGWTPLHIICKKDFSDESRCKETIKLATIFFKINDELNHSVQVDALDKLGRTPLQWAVTSLMLDVINILLDRGADFSKFVFPTENHFAKCIESLHWQGLLCELNLVFRIVDIIKYIENKGYELERSDALTIMKIFNEFELFNEPVNIEEYRHCFEDFAIDAKKIMINSIFSLHDLIQLQPKKGTKLFTTTDFLLLVRSEKFSKYNNYAWSQFLSRLMAEKFCRRWVLTFFMELTQYRLPILCCEKIIAKLEIGDLWKVCLAAPCKSY